MNENGNAGAASGGGRKRGRYLRLLWLLVLVPVVYFAVQVAFILAPSMQYEVATLDTMTESIAVTGQVVLNSRPVYSSTGGVPYYTVPTGQRVAADSDIAMIFKSESGVQAMDNLYAVEQEIAGLVEAQETDTAGGAMETLLDEMQDGLYNVLASAEVYDYTQLDEAKNEVTLAANKIQIIAGDAQDFGTRIAALEALKAQYQAQARPVATVQAAEVGFFVPSSARDVIPMGYEAISALPPLALQEALAAPPSYYGANVIGHIVSDFKWNFFTTVSAKDAEKFVVGDKSLQLLFPGAGNVSVPVEVQNVVPDAENGLAAVELFCEYVGPEVLTLRVEEAQVVFGAYKGIRLSKSALRMQDVTNEDGSVNTYRGVYEEFGNMAYFRRIDIVMENEHYMMVPARYEEGVNEVELYDKIIIDSGGVELHDRRIL
ncbi:MAG TPA: hypothetical protein DEB31_00360 [Clostridiales bacterium]|nr:hypothetical protein [Clostridiales bacterium]